MTSVSVIERLDGLAPLGDEWNALADRCGAPLVDHDWCVSCVEALHRGQALRVVTVREDGRLAGVAPLVLDGSPGGGRLTLLGAARLYEPGGWLFTSDEVLDRLATEVMALGRPLLLHRIAAESPICTVLPRIPRHRAVTVVRTGAASLAVVRRGTWDDYYRGLSSRITVNLPRLQRKAERDLGPMTVARVSPTVQETRALLDALAEVEDSGWKGRAGSSLRRQPDLYDFFARYCERAAARSRLRVTTLHFGDGLAAAELAIEACGRHWQLKIAYRDELSQYYPGLQLTKGSIHAAFERGLDAYEFLGSAASWEQPWRPQAREYRTIATYPINVVGMRAACGDVASAVWRRARPSDASHARSAR